MTNTPIVTEVTQLTVPVGNQPGVLADLLSTLGNEINLEGISAETSGDVSLIRFLVDSNPTTVINLLTSRGLQVMTTLAFSVELPNLPGSLAGFVQQFRTLGVNIRNIYSVVPAGALTSRIVFTVDSPALLSKLLSNPGIILSEPALV